MKIYSTSLIIKLFIGILIYSIKPCKAQMDAKLTSYLQKLDPKYKVSMSVEDIRGRKLFIHREEIKVPAASVIKIPIMIELMEQVKVGKINLDESYTIQESDKAGGSGVLANEKATKTLTIKELCQEMIRVSDNTATNILIRKLGMKAINDRLAKLGAKQTRLNRIMMDTEAVKQGRENWVNTLEINDLLRKIYLKKVANPSLCDLMIDILKKCEDNTTIPHNLPKNLIIAHKTGGLDYVRGDAAIVFTKKPFILSIFVEGFSKVEDAEKIIAELAEIAVNEQ